MKANGGYVQGVGYALNKLGAIANVYNYIDAAHHGWIGWDTNFGPTARHHARGRPRLRQRQQRARLHHQHGQLLGADASRTSPINTSVSGTAVRQSKWVDWNCYIDELTFAQAFRSSWSRSASTPTSAC